MVYIIGVATSSKQPVWRAGRSLTVIVGPSHDLGGVAVSEAVEPNVILELPDTVVGPNTWRNVRKLAGDGFPAAQLGWSGIPGFLDVRRCFHGEVASSIVHSNNRVPAVVVADVELLRQTDVTAGIPGVISDVIITF